jgi:predicted anti-sigma-YlaC factor YlaD
MHASNARVARLAVAVAVSGLAVAGPGCSLRKMAIASLSDTLAKQSATFAEDDDPELIGAAVPFALKTTEALTVEAPRHRGLRLAAASGFVQYAYGFLEQEADIAEAQDLARATALRARARRLYLRGRDQGLRGIELDLPQFFQRLRAHPAAAVAGAQKRHTPLLYWTALGWFGAINLAKDDAELTADQHLAEALMRRALALDEGFADGTLHDFFVAWEGRSPAAGGSRSLAREHLVRALALSHGRRAWPLVAFAESVSVGEQDRKGFEELLRQALAVDPDAEPKYRLSNVIIQRRARWLLGRVDELFIE